MNEVKLNVDGSQVKFSTIVTTVPMFNSVKNILAKYVDNSIINEISAEIRECFSVRRIILSECEGKFYEVAVNNGIPKITKVETIEKIEKLLEYKGIQKKFSILCADELFRIAITHENTTKWNINSSYNSEIVKEYHRGENVKKSICHESNYVQPIKPTWIPEGFKYYFGNFDNGYVIKDKEGNEFVFNPDSGNYISRYTISKSAGGTPMSTLDRSDWTNLTLKEARRVSQAFHPCADILSIEEYYIWKQFLLAKKRNVKIKNIMSHTKRYGANCEEAIREFSFYNIFFACTRENHKLWTTEQIDECNLVVSPLDYRELIKSQEVERVGKEYRSGSIAFRIVLYNPESTDM